MADTDELTLQQEESENLVPRLDLLELIPRASANFHQSCLQRPVPSSQATGARHNTINHSNGGFRTPFMTKKLMQKWTTKPYVTLWQTGPGSCSKRSDGIEVTDTIWVSFSSD
ncbi:hypothetical protein DPMN_042114 [Dreissena polymorpha]|uniref:Uncharacterized protein n=1 Tax=Dreissena polymorpha TaxID=45954 RepID=A0A9D4HWS0_DREPO|nr:hypothetical protein DPMN_042114 [Dreissena polymorpha]